MDNGKRKARRQVREFKVKEQAGSVDQERRRWLCNRFVQPRESNRNMYRVGGSGREGKGRMKEVGNGVCSKK